MKHLKNFIYKNNIYTLSLTDDSDNTEEVIMCNKSTIFMYKKTPYIAMSNGDDNEILLFKYNYFCDPTDNVEKPILYDISENTINEVREEFERLKPTLPVFGNMVDNSVLVKDVMENNDYILNDESENEEKTTIEEKIIRKKIKNPFKLSKGVVIIFDFVLFLLIGYMMIYFAKMTNNEMAPSTKSTTTTSEFQTESENEEISEETTTIKNNDVILENIEQTEIVTATNDLPLLVSNVMPSIVSILSTEDMSNSEYQLLYEMYEVEEQIAGSGIIIGKNDSELLIATNYHVVANTTNIAINFSVGNTEKSYNALVKGGDELNDLAVIAINLSELDQQIVDNIKIASVGNTEDLQLGQDVAIIGNACGYGQSVSKGIVSALNRMLDEEGPYVQVDASVNPGASGGALIDISGNVVGIVCGKLADTDIEGIGYAIPTNVFKDILKDLSSKTTRKPIAEADRGYLGIYGTSVTESASEMYDMPLGAFVSKISKEGASYDSLLQAKDIIVAVNDVKVNSMPELQKELTYHKKGENVKLTVIRFVVNEYQEVEINVKLSSSLE